MNIKALTPGEAPLPFAADKVPQTFALNETKTKHSTRILSAYRAKKTYRPPVRFNIPQGAAGWKMTDGEWKGVVDTLRSKGIVCKLRTKELLDMALEKHGSGKSWPEMGARHITAVTTYSKWKLNGNWDELKTALVELRGKAPSRSRRAPEVAPQGSRSPLPKGPNGYQMSPDEWKSVADILQSQGFGVRLASVANINLALEKVFTGKTWDQVALGNGGPCALCALWRRTGRWEALEAVLTQLRTATAS
jgi:hypothetical protein